VVAVARATLGLSAVSSEATFVNWLSSLAIVVDLANGAPETTALRGTLVAAAAAAELGLNQEDAAAAVYGALFRYLGCTSYAHEDADLFGDEHEAARLLAGFEPTEYSGIMRVVATKLGTDESVLARGQRLARLAVSGQAFRVGYESSQCEGATLLASRLDVTPRIRDVLQLLFARWDGTGAVTRAAGTSIPIAARVVHIARETTVQFLLRGGRKGVVDCLERRAGGQLDPDLCRALANSETFLSAFTDDRLWESTVKVLATHLRQAFTAVPSLDALVEVFGDFADQKSPWFLGHARKVATLVSGAARQLGFDPQTTTTLVRAAWLHDVGRVSVANRVWDTPGPLGPIQWEKVRLHAYVGERVCLHLDERLAALVGQHHERSDGSGYARGIKPDQVASVLCAADVCVALSADRPHRSRLDPDARVRILEAEVREGRLRGEAVRAVLASAGERSIRTPPKTELLSEREREVLSLVARGLSNKEVGRTLGISARTVQAHTIRVYDKLGVRTRAGAALRASELGLLGGTA
jgi:HD-GYP domain-containing protein (c-di-GMP phosphodiesterase class II)